MLRSSTEPSDREEQPYNKPSNTVTYANLQENLPINTDQNGAIYADIVRNNNSDIVNSCNPENEQIDSQQAAVVYADLSVVINPRRADTDQAPIYAEVNKHK